MSIMLGNNFYRKTNKIDRSKTSIVSIESIDQ
ncbi:hypothetical protein VIS19158_10809 [Vibrio scophthalmi LMG 19158]|uniref:Uncharacterized protein n=1 Tax=Vibrio scophthalmi LMG 19158 TaxID=870967 RepID=F9RNW7_9VIBR|nr:hypothetical protein VIS19158_10809 [Vibrio scophthalmi LMG 19158]